MRRTRHVKRSANLKCSRKRQTTLITGGAGFIGCNLAHRLLSERQPVIILDNLARPGVEQNLQWLRSKHGNLLQVEIADIRDVRAISRILGDVSQVFHLAAQVAVTASLSDPISDFGVNARGTLNLLEALRNLNDPPPLIFTSTNKVYGALDDVPLIERSTRYELADPNLFEYGVPETRPLSFHSPYGCSKGAADQYITDYAHTFSFPTIVFRMSCIYGPHQFGTEDQGWVAHFLIRALCGEPITIYGDGKQVRDILYVDDLIDALLLARQHIEKLSGEVFNIGGGPPNSISLLELIQLIGELHGAVPPYTTEPWRRADQRSYVSDYRKFQRATGWTPGVTIREGVARLYDWLAQDMATRPRAALAETAI